GQDQGGATSRDGQGRGDHAVRFNARQPGDTRAVEAGVVTSRLDSRGCCVPRGGLELTVSEVAKMSRRFARTTKGHGEIVEGRRNLRGKVRTLLFLIDPAKSAEQIEQQAEQIGATYEQLAQLMT